MLEKDKLRKADFFSGFVISLFGIWIIWMALQMPMKDSWGGVQNVWFVSPALFPLFVGAMICLLGGVLSLSALKLAGAGEIKAVFKWLLSRRLFASLNSEPMLRFYAIILLFTSFVFLYLPRIDFFVASLLFLVAFITMFYFDNADLLKKLFFFYLYGTVFFLLYFLLAADQHLSRMIPYAADVLMICFLMAYCIFAWTLARADATLRRKYRLSLIVAVTTPFILGPIFKYFLLVPMPTEGLVVAALDYVWYLEFL